MNDSRDLTVDGLAHDLNNVFETLVEAADLLADDPKWTELAAVIRRSAERGHRIANSVRSIAEPPPHLRDALDAAARAASDSYGHHWPPIDFEFLLEDITLPGAPAEWERVFVNLFANSARFMPNGGLIKVMGLAEPDGTVEILIHDSGPGIAPEALPYLFNPYFTTADGHAGLGLYIVKSIIEKHRGSVSARNKPDLGSGAEFRIWLPATLSSLERAVQDDHQADHRRQDHAVPQREAE